MDMGKLYATTPDRIGNGIRKFCRSFTKNEPQFVPVVPEGPQGHCYPNVQEKIKQHGGSVVYGRTIWMGKYLIEAEWHCVWSDSRCPGQLLDVTSKEDNEERIVFVQTDEVWDGKSLFFNLRKTLVNNFLVQQYLAIQDLLEKKATRSPDGGINIDLGAALANLVKSM
jgi:hypothetical protein